MEFIQAGNHDISLIIDAPIGFIQRKIKFNREEYPAIIFSRFLKYGFIEEDGVFTIKGG